ANATSPMRVPDTWSFTNDRAASWATASRLGCTSVAHIDRDTSRARMTLVRPSGTFTETCGRAVATPNPVILTTNTATARDRRHGYVAPPPCPGRDRRPHERDVGEPHRLLALAAQLPQIAGQQERHDEQQQEGERRLERHQTNLPNQTSDNAPPMTRRSALI